MKQKTKELLDYILPSVGGLCVTYLYNIVDGIFIGQGVGHLALGAVNITVPFITIMIAVSTLFAMGGSTVIAIRLGRGDRKGANDAFMTSLVMMLILSIILLAIGTVFTKQIVLFSGSSKSMLPMASEYLFFYTLFAVPFLCSNCLSMFVRNDGAPGLAFWGMLSGAAANIFLDWLLIFPLNMGLKGAAIASGLGQVLSLFILLSHFAFKKGQLRIQKFSVSIKLIGKVCKRGVPEFFSQLNTPVTVFCYNLVLAKILGDLGIATFSILSFIYSLATAVLSGVAQGLQPLWGQAFGRHDLKGLKQYLQTGLKINIICSIVIYIVLFLFRSPVVAIFNSNQQLIEMGSSALPVFALSFLFMAVNFIYTAYFYSTKKTSLANLIAISRSVIIKAPAIFWVPVFFGSTFVWWSVVIAEGITMIFAILCRKFEKKALQI